MTKSMPNDGEFMNELVLHRARTRLTRELNVCQAGSIGLLTLSDEDGPDFLPTKALREEAVKKWPKLGGTA